MIPATARKMIWYGGAPAAGGGPIGTDAGCPARAFQTPRSRSSTSDSTATGVRPCSRTGSPLGRPASRSPIMSAALVKPSAHASARVVSGSGEPDAPVSTLRIALTLTPLARAMSRKDQPRCARRRLSRCRKAFPSTRSSRRARCSSVSPSGGAPLLPARSSPFGSFGSSIRSGPPSACDRLHAVYVGFSKLVSPTGCAAWRRVDGRPVQALSSLKIGEKAA